LLDSWIAVIAAGAHLLQILAYGKILRESPKSANSNRALEHTTAELLCVWQ
jgi:hypothetical protein